MQNCTFLKYLGLKRHMLYFVAVGRFIDKMLGGKQDKRVGTLWVLLCKRGE
jgi:hypothetical protein